MGELEQKICPECGQQFGCGAAAGRCWCFDLPPLAMPDEASSDCLCPDCLMKAIEEQKQRSKPVD